MGQVLQEGADALGRLSPTATLYLMAPVVVGALLPLQLVLELGPVSRYFIHGQGGSAVPCPNWEVDASSISEVGEGTSMGEGRPAALGIAVGICCDMGALCGGGQADGDKADPRGAAWCCASSYTCHSNALSVNYTVGMPDAGPCPLGPTQPIFAVVRLSLSLSVCGSLSGSLNCLLLSHLSLAGCLAVSPSVRLLPRACILDLFLSSPVSCSLCLSADASLLYIYQQYYSNL